MRIIIAITGASGVNYGLRIIDILAKLGHKIDLVISDGAIKVIEYEIENFEIEKLLKQVTSVYDVKDIGSALASGTHPSDGMIIAPCSMKTLAAIASGFTQNLIQRAADCMLKEERKLVLILRETPLNLIHLKNMVKAKEAGASILPASPGFYHKPKTIDDLIDFIAGKALNLFKIDHKLYAPWNPKNSV